MARSATRDGRCPGHSPAGSALANFSISGESSKVIQMLLKPCATAFEADPTVASFSSVCLEGHIGSGDQRRKDCLLRAISTGIAGDCDAIADVQCVLLPPLSMQYAWRIA